MFVFSNTVFVVTRPGGTPVRVMPPATATSSATGQSATSTARAQRPVLPPGMITPGMGGQWHAQPLRFTVSGGHVRPVVGMSSTLSDRFYILGNIMPSNVEWINGKCIFHESICVSKERILHSHALLLQLRQRHPALPHALRTLHKHLLPAPVYRLAPALRTLSGHLQPALARILAAAPPTHNHHLQPSLRPVRFHPLSGA